MKREHDDAVTDRSNDARDGASQVRFTFCKKEETLAAAEERLSKLHA